MRIRKRFPLSSVASSASDPQLNRLPWVQPPTSQPSDPPTQPLSDQPPTIGADKLDSTWRNNFEIKKKESEKLKLEEASHEAEEEKIGSKNTRKEHNFFAAAPVEETRVLPPLDSDQVGERWFDGDKKIPLKKRKGPVVDKIGCEETLMLEKEKKMKSKTNKKCSTTKVQRNQDKEENDDNRSTDIGKKTNVKRGSAIMEGSRCSRVNGRGWRCCQQTLVGYSLCEHHLGKGRLRSITSVRGRAKAVPSTVAAATTTIAPHNDTTTTTTTTDNNVIDVCSDKKDLASSSVVQPAAAAAQGYKEIILLDGNCYDDDEDEEEDEDDDDYNNDTMKKKPPVAKKKKMKLGMVKARSLSSLLNQTD